MSLQVRLSALIDAIGADIKALQASSGGGSSGPTQPLLVSALNDDFESGDLSKWTTVTQEGDGTFVNSTNFRTGTRGATSTVSANTGSKANLQEALGSTNTVVLFGGDWRVRAEGASGSNVPFTRAFQGSQRLADIYRNNINGQLWARVTKADGVAFNFIDLGVTLPLNTWASVVWSYDTSGNLYVAVNGSVLYQGVITDRFAATKIDLAYVGAEHPVQVGTFDVDNLSIAAQSALDPTGGESHSWSTTTQTGFATDTYMAGSAIAIPKGKLKVGTKVRWKFNCSKTAAGVATPIITIRSGTNGSTADSSRGTLTFAAQTAVSDEGVFEIEGTVRAIGSSTVIQFMGSIGHRLATTGISTGNNSIAILTTSAFDSTGTNLKIGFSLNAGSSASWTVNLCNGELINVAP